MLTTALCLAAAAAGYLLGYGDGKRKGRNDLDKVLRDFGKLAGELAQAVTGHRS